MATPLRRVRRPYHFSTKLAGYPVAVLVSVGETVEAIREQLARKHGCSNDTCMADWQWEQNGRELGHTSILPCNRTVLWLRHDDLADTSLLGIIGHEIFHLIIGAFENLGMRLTDASDEAYAYAIGGLTESVIDGLKNHRKKRSAIIRANGAHRPTLSERRADVRPRTGKRAGKARRS